MSNRLVVGCAVLFSIQLSNPCLAGQAAPQPPAAAPPARACGTNPFCVEANNLAVLVSESRTSASGNQRFLSVTLKILNKTTGPLILGYKDNSGVAIDDQGNRYSAVRESVRGIGIISPDGIDPKFQLSPRESRDMQFEFTWSPSGREIFGTMFDVNLTIREIDPVGATRQVREGREYPLSFHKIVDRSSTASQPSTAASPAVPGRAPVAPSPTASSAPATSAPAASVPRVDACAGIARCSSSGPFSAQITHLTSVLPNMGFRNDHALRVTVRFKNTSDKPLTLGYVENSATAVDNYGNQFGRFSIGDGTPNIQGIPRVTRGTEIVGDFTLAPGQSRDALFQVQRLRDSPKPIGTSFTWNVTTVQMEYLPGGQVRLGSEFAMTFSDLVADPPSKRALQESVGEQCAAAAHCYDAGPVVAEVTRAVATLTPTLPKDHIVNLTVRFKNVSAQPISLAYKATTSMAVDNLGNPYWYGRVNALDSSTQGMPIDQGRSVGSFSLKAGESREAIFQVKRFEIGKAALGDSFIWSATIEQLENLSADQIRVTAEHVITFPDLAVSGGGLLNKLLPPKP